MPTHSQPYKNYPTHATRPWSDSVPKKSRKWLFIVLLAASLLALVAAPFLLAGSAFGYFQISGRIIPGVYTGGAQLGGRTVSQAAVEIFKYWGLEKLLAVTDGIHTWQVTPAELGLIVEPIQTAQLAYEVGHNQPLVVETEQMAHSLVRGWGIAPQVSVDEAAAQRWLAGLANQANLAPVDASIALGGDRLVAVPGQAGYAVDVESALDTLKKDPQAVLVAGFLRLQLIPVAPSVEDVSTVLAQGEAFLSNSASIALFDPINDEYLDIPVSRAELASWLLIETGESGPILRLDQNAVERYLEDLNSDLGDERYIDATAEKDLVLRAVQDNQRPLLVIHHRPTRYTVQPGDTMIKIGWKLGFPYWMIVNANPSLNPDALHTGQVLVIPSKDDLLPVPVVPGKRILISISKQRLWMYQDREMIAEHVISTGINRSPTQPGVFQVQTHEPNAYASIWDLYMPDFLGIYEAWPGFMNGIHGLPTLSNGRRLWANVLGRPASYGCIILDLKASHQLYDWAENGVVVEIQP